MVRAAPAGGEPGGRVHPHGRARGDRRRLGGRRRGGPHLRRHFLRALLSGRRFGEAVQQARRETWERHRQMNTWGAYQCYGDSDYRLGDMVQPQARRPARRSTYRPPRRASTCTTWRAQSPRRKSGAAKASRRASRTSKRACRISLRNDNAMNARLGSVYYDLGDFANALRCYRMAERAELAPRDIEHYANAAARRAEQLADSATGSWQCQGEARGQVRSNGDGKSARTGRPRDHPA